VRPGAPVHRRAGARARGDPTRDGNMTQRHPRRTAPAALAAAAPLIAILALAAAATPAGAQTAMEDPGRSQVTRAELLELLAHYEAAMESGAYSSALRARARTEAALIRARLA